MSLVKATNKARKQLHVKLDMRLFNASLFKNDVAIEYAIGVFEEQLQVFSKENSVVISRFIDQPYLLAFLLSAIDEAVFECLCKQVLEQFPTNAADYQNTLAAKLLNLFSHYYWSLGISLDSQDDSFKAVQAVLQVLNVLASVQFPPESPEDDTFQIAKRQSQRDRKRSKRNRAPTIDRVPFEKAGYLVPNTREQATILETRVLSEQKDILEFYLRALRRKSLAERIKFAYIPREPSLDDRTSTGSPKNDGAFEHSSTDGAVLENVIPAAYPVVQPMKAAFYFDSIDGFGEWHILISTRANRDLREYRKKDPKVFTIILKKIKELSRGYFSDNNQKRLVGSDADIPIFEAKMTRDTRLVYVVDCVKEFDSEMERQVIRVFGIYTHAQLDKRLWGAVSQHLSSKGKEYRKRCIFRKAPIHSGDNVVSPQIFPVVDSEEATAASPFIPNIHNEDKEELHALLSLEKFVAFSQALLNTILADQDVAHVFQMSPAEQDIVRHSGSCYVIGRSGTGKTTTMLFKIFGIERAWEKLKEDFADPLSRPRQMFVTQSRVLAERVEEYYSKLAESHMASQRTAQQSAELAAAKKDHRAQGLVNRDEEEIYHGTLPHRYGDLKDEHFPLFVTFDQLSRLLEAHITDKKLILSGGAGEADPDMQSTEYMLQRRNSFVSYDTFVRSYWPHLSQPLTKGLDPALVFAEFMGVIKGSEMSLQNEQGFLDQESYVNLSVRQQGMFAGRRQPVYSLFLAYLKRKRERREWDAADRTRTLLRALKKYGFPGQKLDFIYVDEAQDNLLIDALVLRTLCSNPDGLFWAGDTAQTISVGSAFRFNDLKAFLYRIENTGSITGESPRSFQLTINYRSHGGIVRCAHSIVSLITRFWPHAIDVLAEEKGLVDGAKPAFFSGWNQDTVQYEQFLFGSSAGQIEFGAKQCILVRDDTARARLRSTVGDIGTILTLYESKGLEFDDVLLFNFFQDSHVDESQWRVVLNALPETKGPRTKCPEFDELSHSGVCRELKFLYVALTRARKNVWIADCSDRAQPLRTFWNAHDLIKDCPRPEDAPRLATVSTGEEWAETALTLFDNGRYSQAMRCYECASMPRERDVAHAYYLREQARALPARRLDNSVRITAFMSAAEAFLRSAKASGIKKEVFAYYRIAGDCFQEVGDHKDAARAYLAAEEFTRSAQCYRKAGLFDDAVEIVQAHRDRIKKADADNIIDVAKLHYFKHNQIQRATRLFPTLDDALEFMEDFGFQAALADLLEGVGRLTDAAELRSKEGHTIRAIELLLRDSANPSSQQCAEDYLIDGLWQHFSIGLVTKDAVAQPLSVLDDLLALASRMAQGMILSPKGVDEVHMFRILAGQTSADLQLLGSRFSTVHHDTASAILCFDHAFSRGFRIQIADCYEVASVLQDFAAYTREMGKLMAEDEPTDRVDFQRLFGFRPSGDAENTFVVKGGTLLAQAFCKRQPHAVVFDDFVLPKWELKSLLRDVLSCRLLQRGRAENDACRKASAFNPCATFATTGQCNSASCDASYHLTPTQLDLQWHKTRLRIMLQQILIYQVITPFENKITAAIEQKYWLSSLYYTLYPVHYQLGTWPSASLPTFPELSKGLQVVKLWTQNTIYNLDPWANDHEFFLTMVAELACLGYSFDLSSARAYMERARCISVERPLFLLRGAGVDRRYIIHDLLCCLENSDAASIPAGILFLQSILDKSLHFDVNVLCHLIERVTACIVISYRIWWYGSVHDTTLTREWLLRLHGDTGGKDTRQLALFLRVVSELMIEVYYWRRGFLLFEGGSRINRQQQNIFVARLFRCLVLLGYNIPNNKLREDIQGNITYIYHSGNLYPRMLVRYIKAKSWPDLVRALRTSINRNPFDELIQIKDESKCRGTLRSLGGTRLVIYKNVKDIPSLLWDNSPPSVATGPSEQPSQLSEETDQSRNEQDELEPANDDDDDDNLSSPDEDDAEIDHNIDIQAVTQAADEGRAYEPPAPPTPQELAAAGLIAKFYRCSIARRKGTPKKGLAEARARWFQACRQGVGDTPTEYRHLYLGPVPHALVCAEGVVTYAAKAKKNASARLQKVEHEEYEAVSAELNRTSRIFKDGFRLKKLLEPGSELHLKQDCARLATSIMELKELLNSLPAGTADQWKHDLDIAYKGIVESRKPPKKERKPSLVVDFKDDLMY